MSDSLCHIRMFSETSVSSFTTVMVTVIKLRVTSLAGWSQVWSSAGLAIGRTGSNWVASITDSVLMRRVLASSCDIHRNLWRDATPLHLLVLPWASNVLYTSVWLDSGLKSWWVENRSRWDYRPRFLSRPPLRHVWLSSLLVFTSISILEPCKTVTVNEVNHSQPSRTSADLEALRGIGARRDCLVCVFESSLIRGSPSGLDRWPLDGAIRLAVAITMNPTPPPPHTHIHTQYFYWNMVALKPPQRYAWRL